MNMLNNHYYSKSLLFFVALICVFCTSAIAQETRTQAVSPKTNAVEITDPTNSTFPLPQKPNIVMIMVDDAGYMEYGGFGGEAETPNINKLADQGLRFTNYHTSTLCAPSRAMLLTGIDNHKTGIATIAEMQDKTQSTQQGYSQVLEDGVLTIADHLRSAGYRTLMTGKWHLGDGEGDIQNDLPYHHGFDRSFILDASGADNWDQRSYMPYYKTAPWFEDDQPATLPKDFYSSKFIVDKMVDYIDDSQNQDQPFFAYLAFQAIHIPVQAPQEFIDKYEGVYDQGWEVLQEKRWQRAKEMGLIPANAPKPDMPKDARKWADLSSDEQALYAKSMQIQAGMIDAMDYHIGRLVNHLAKNGDLENTVFVITSDNGPEFNDLNTETMMHVWMRLNDYDNNLDTLGLRGSNPSIGMEWASATASPFVGMKFYSNEGGTRVPMILSGKGVKRSGHSHAALQVSDITPTLLDMIGIAPIKNENTIAMTGDSFAPLIHDPYKDDMFNNRPIGMEVSGNAFLIKGDYKLRKMTLPRGDGQWKLFNIKNDPIESQNLATQEPEKFAELMTDYENYARENGVIALPEDYDLRRTLSQTNLKKLFSHHPITMWGIVVVVLLCVGSIFLLFIKILRRVF